MRLLIWPPLIFGGVCALLALLKRRSPLNWLLLGIFFQFFALGILLFLPTLNVRPDVGTRSSGELNCPRCNGQIRLDTQHCPHCGQDVHPIEVEKGRVE